MSVNFHNIVAGMSKIVFREKWMGQNGTKCDGMRLNNNDISFKNTIDYHLWTVNEICQYRSHRTWMEFIVQDWS